MKFRLQVDGKEYTISATPDGSITIDGQTFETKTSSANADRRMIQVADKTVEVRVVESAQDVGCFILEVAGERVPLTVSDLVRESGAAPAAPSGTAAGAGAAAQASQPVADAADGLFAPVPGKIVNVLVKVGDLVEEGTPLVVLEAMKMENELRAPKKGKVTVLAVQKGDTAQRGQLLVGIE